MPMSTQAMKKNRAKFPKNNLFDLGKKGFIDYTVFIVSGCESVNNEKINLQDNNNLQSVVFLPNTKMYNVTVTAISMYTDYVRWLTSGF